LEQDDFDEMMKEIVPQLIDQHVQEQQPEDQSSSPMGFSTRRDADDPTRHVEALMAAFLQKRAQKELKPSGHTPDMQQKIDESEKAEWETLLGKQAVRVWTGAKGKQIREKQSIVS
jgi:hypothetical protein